MKKVLITILVLLLASSAYSQQLTLKQAVQDGVANHESIKAAEELEKKQEYRLKKAKSSRLFSVNAGYSFTGLKEEPVSRSMGRDVQIGEEDLYAWRVTLEQPVFTGFALQSAQNIEKIGVKNSRNNTITASLDVAHRIKKAYAAFFFAEKTMDVANQTLLTLKAHKNDAEKFYSNGLVPYNDLLKAEVSLAQAEQNMEQAIAMLKNSRTNLNILAGLPPAQETEIEPLKEPENSQKDFSILKKEAFSKRPEIKTLDNTLEILDNSKKIAQSAYYPQVMLTLGYMQNGDDSLATQNDFNNGHNASIAVQAKWTLFDFQKRSSDVRASIHEKKSAQEKLKELKEMIHLQVETSLRNLNVAKKNIKTAKESVKQAKENWRITNIQYREQTTTSTEVLNARTYLTTAENGYYKALYQYWSAMADLERAVGTIQ